MVQVGEEPIQILVQVQETFFLSLSFNHFLLQGEIFTDFDEKILAYFGD